MAAAAFVYDGAMQGLHLTADLYKCRCADSWLIDARQLGEWLVEAVQAAGLQPAGHLFQGGAEGVAATVLAAGSHVCLHTWPEQRASTVDVYVCTVGDDQAAKARALVSTLLERFQPEWTEQRSLDRGDGE